MSENYSLSYVVVDDDDDDRLLMRMALEKAQRTLPVFEFSDGQELIDYLTENAQRRADTTTHWLVVLDINMPRMNGLEAIKRIRQNPFWSKMPVLMLSTSDDPDLIRESLSCGANGYITKPQSAQQFVEIFDNFFAPWLAT